MIAFKSRIPTRRYLLSGLLALVGAISASAEVLVPFTPGNLLVPTVNVTVTNADGLYTSQLHKSARGNRAGAGF